jgi:hypothetical protein
MQSVASSSRLLLHAARMSDISCITDVHCKTQFDITSRTLD